MLCVRYCGELSSLALTSTTSSLVVMFHSDESFTDKGFQAQYNAYDPSNREWFLSGVIYDSGLYETSYEGATILWYCFQTPLTLHGN